MIVYLNIFASQLPKIDLPLELNYQSTFVISGALQYFCSCSGLLLFCFGASRSSIWELLLTFFKQHPSSAKENHICCWICCCHLTPVLFCTGLFVFHFALPFSSGLLCFLLFFFLLQWTIGHISIKSLLNRSIHHVKEKFLEAGEAISYSYVFM